MGKANSFVTRKPKTPRRAAFVLSNKTKRLPLPVFTPHELEHRIKLQKLLSPVQLSELRTLPVTVSTNVFRHALPTLERVLQTHGMSEAQIRAAVQAAPWDALRRMGGRHELVEGNLTGLLAIRRLLNGQAFPDFIRFAAASPGSISSLVTVIEAHRERVSLDEAKALLVADYTDVASMERGLGLLRQRAAERAAKQRESRGPSQPRMFRAHA